MENFPPCEFTKIASSSLYSTKIYVKKYFGYSNIDFYIIGEFVDMMKKCNKARDYTEIDNAIREKVTPYLYNGGKGKWVPVSEIIHVRNCIRTGQKIEPPPPRSYQRSVKAGIHSCISELTV